MASLEALLEQLRRCAGFEDLGGATTAAEAIARLGSDKAVDALIRLLVEIDDIDLTDDAGDVGDEVWRTRAAVSRGLELCGDRAIASLRPLIAGPVTERGQAALAILAKRGDPAAIPIAIDWVERGVMFALVPLGELAPPNAVEIIARAIDQAPELNAGWTKRLAQLADPDWFARLGVAEALQRCVHVRARTSTHASRPPRLTRRSCGSRVSGVPSRRWSRAKPRPPPRISPAFPPTSAP
jgi:hypothetical protein